MKFICTMMCILVLQLKFLFITENVAEALPIDSVKIICNLNCEQNRSRNVNLSQKSQNETLMKNQDIFMFHPFQMLENNMTKFQRDSYNVDINIGGSNSNDGNNELSDSTVELLGLGGTLLGVSILAGIVYFISMKCNKNETTTQHAVETEITPQPPIENEKVEHNESEGRNKELLDSKRMICWGNFTAIYHLFKRTKTEATSSHVTNKQKNTEEHARTPTDTENSNSALGMNSLSHEQKELNLVIEDGCENSENSECVESDKVELSENCDTVEHSTDDLNNHSLSGKQKELNLVIEDDCENSDNSECVESDQVESSENCDTVEHPTDDLNNHVNTSQTNEDEMNSSIGVQTLIEGTDVVSSHKNFKVLDNSPSECVNNMENNSRQKISDLSTYPHSNICVDTVNNRVYNNLQGSNKFNGTVLHTNNGNGCVMNKEQVETEWYYTAKSLLNTQNKLNQNNELPLEKLLSNKNIENYSMYDLDNK